MSQVQVHKWTIILSMMVILSGGCSSRDTNSRIVVRNIGDQLIVQLHLTIDASSHRFEQILPGQEISVVVSIVGNAKVMVATKYAGSDVFEADLETGFPPSQTGELIIGINNGLIHKLTVLPNWNEEEK